MPRRLTFGLLQALHLLPPVLAWTSGSRYVFWFASSLLIAAAVMWLWESGGFKKRLMSVALNFCVVFANVLLAISFMIQGVGFNVEFFAHANWDTIRIASIALRPLVIGVGAYMLLTLATPLMMRRSSAAAQRGNRVVALAAAAGLLMNASAWSFAWHFGGLMADAHSAIWVPKRPMRLMPAHGGGDGADAAAQTSLVVIFAESLEDTYARSDIFGEDLTPELTALEAEGLKFTDMRQVSHTSWTTGALVAVQCSRPMSAHGKNLDILHVFAFGPEDDAVQNATCLGDVLAAQGYQSVLMAGTFLQFGGVDVFHAAHGFGERLGFDELGAAAGPLAWTRRGDENNMDYWLVEDDALFALARKKVDELAGSSQPFLLALTTMDTHGPSGFPSKVCGAAKGLIATVQCADKLIAKFIKDVRTTHPSVMVALLSDHLVGPGGVDAEVMSKLAGRGEERRLRFAVWGEGLLPAVVNRPGTHFDVMPTLMDLLGLDAWGRHYLGASLLRHESPWFTHGSPLSLKIVHSLPDLRVLPGDEIAFAADGPTITMDGQRILATSKGLQLRSALFAVELDAEGGVVDFHVFPPDTRTQAPSAAGSNFAAWAEGRRLVGVSTSDAYKPAALDGSLADAYFFAGSFGTKGFASGPLRRRSVVAMPGTVD